MDEMTLHVPVNVKAVLTTALRSQLKLEMEDAIRNVELELQQLEFQAKRMIAEQQKTDPQLLPQLYNYLDSERSKRLEFKKVTEDKLERLEKLELGSEITNGTIDRSITVKLGDDLIKYMGAEILLEDGKIIAFRM